MIGNNCIYIYICDIIYGEIPIGSVSSLMENQVKSPIKLDRAYMIISVLFKSHKSHRTP